MLFAGGENLDISTNSVTVMGKEYPIPDYMRQTDDQMSLKHVCRLEIRKHLININPRQHLFRRIAELGQPPLISNFLLYGMSLD